VVMLLTSDEEIGTDAGLKHLRPVAEQCSAVFCTELPLPGGRAKTARSGVGTFSLKVHGIASHAGVDYSRGASAILELSRLIVRLHALTDLERGMQVSAGIIRGGSASNVIAAEAEAEIDFRFKSMEEGKLLEDQIRTLKPTDPRCSISFEGGINRPPLERSGGVIRLYERARALAAIMGMELGEGATGGGSDGSFTASMGIPTLDGLGADGGGAHATGEHIILSEIPRRAALLGAMIAAMEE
jgi:glutamate carboxypeptidase